MQGRLKAFTVLNVDVYKGRRDFREAGMKVRPEGNVLGMTSRGEEP